MTTNTLANDIISAIAAMNRFETRVALASCVSYDVNVWS
jgi:hypothetical protein